MAMTEQNPQFPHFVPEQGGATQLTRRNFLELAAAAFLTAACSPSPEAGTPIAASPSHTEQAPATSISAPELDASREQNLLKGNWSFMPGATPEGNGLRIERTSLAILKMDDGGRPPAQPAYVANPPVN